MDIADLAQQREERDRDRAMAARRETGPQATGACLWCGEPLGDGRRWCDALCRDHWERMRMVRGWRLNDDAHG